MFKKVTKLCVKSAGIVYFKIKFKLTPVENGVYTNSGADQKIIIIKTVQWDLNSHSMFFAVSLSSVMNGRTENNSLYYWHN